MTVQVHDCQMYPWDWAPEWAEFGAAEECGSIFFYKAEPYIEDGIWCRMTGTRSEQAGFLKPAHRTLDWRTTLRRRPQ